MKKLAIGSWAYLFKQEPAVTDFHALVHKLQHLGYQGIELYGCAPHPNPDSHDTREKRAKLRKMVVDHKLEFSGLAANLAGHYLWSTDDHAPFLAAFARNAIFAEDLGIKTMRIDTVEPIANAAQVAPKLMLDRCVAAFDKCAKIAADHCITIAWEFEPSFALHKPDEIVTLIDAVRALGNANFGALFDTANAHACATVGDKVPGGALELLQQLKGKITHLHLSDTDGLRNESSGANHVPFGNGVLNFDALMPELLTCGVPNDWWTVDLCYWPDAWPATSECKRFLDKMRHKYAA